MDEKEKKKDLRRRLSLSVGIVQCKILGTVSYVCVYVCGEHQGERNRGAFACTVLYCTVCLCIYI